MNRSANTLPVGLDVDCHVLDSYHPKQTISAPKTGAQHLPQLLSWIPVWHLQAGRQKLRFCGTDRGCGGRRRQSATQGLVVEAKRQDHARLCDRDEELILTTTRSQRIRNSVVGAVLRETRVRVVESDCSQCRRTMFVRPSPCAPFSA